MLAGLQMMRYWNYTISMLTMARTGQWLDS